MKYKVGDKVKIHGVTDHRRKYNGTEGTIRSINPNGSNAYKNRTHYGVKGGEPYIFFEDELDPVKTANNKKIIITTDGKETLARLYEDGKVVKKATAKCSPDDTFDFNVGVKLAFDRLIESASEKKEEYYNGKVVCVDSTGGNEHLYTVGKIYQFVDGKMTCDNGIEMPCYKNIKNFEEWDKFSSSKFIEIIE